MSVIGKKVIIIVSDPWDFQTEYPEPLEGKIIITNHDLTDLGVILSKEFVFMGKTFSHVICSNRYQNQTFEDLSPKGAPCAIIGVSEIRFSLYWSSGEYDFHKSVNLLGSVELK